MKSRSLLAATLAIIGMIGGSHAAVITVNTADNTDFSAGKTNLVRAIQVLNDGDTIAFNIPGAGPHYLVTPAIVLGAGGGGGYPEITKNNVTIDGYTQPGSSANTNPILGTNNAQIKIVIDSRAGGAHTWDIPGYGTSESGMFVVSGHNFTVRGLSFLGIPGEDSGTSPKRYGVALGRGADSAHINGCWFGVDPDGVTVHGFADGVTGFTYTDNDRQTNVVIGVKPGSLNPRAEFNVFCGLAIPVIIAGNSTRVSGNFFGILPDGFTRVPNPQYSGFGWEGHLEFGNEDWNTIIGTDGDGVNDAEERNLFSGGFARTLPAEVVPAGEGRYNHIIEFYGGNSRTNIIIAGNYVGVAIDGVTRLTNATRFMDSLNSLGDARIGSDFNGVSDDLEANVIANNHPFNDLYPNPAVSPLPPAFHGASIGSRLSVRGNKLLNNNLPPFSYADGGGGQLLNYKNYMAPYMNTAVGPQFVNFAGETNPIPVIDPASTVKKLIGTCPPGVGSYTTVIIDVYYQDMQGWTNGQAFVAPELFDGSAYYGFAQGGEYVGSLEDNGPLDSNPAVGAFSFDVSALNIDPAKLITITANYSADPAGTSNGRVHTGDFSMPVQPAPWFLGDLASVGGTRTVADTLLWYNPALNRYTNGNYDLAVAALNLGNWEPYISVLGDSTFLIEANTFADDGSAANQRYAVTFQPATGGAPVIGDAFFSDYGTNYRGQINLSRQNGNPGRVAGDTRYGAVNFIAGGEASPDGFAAFQSDFRWTSNGIYNANNRYTVVQPHALNPLTLAQTPLAKAFDAITGRVGGSPASVTEVARFGGHLTVLDDGNMVVVADDRSGMICPVRTATIVIIAPNGSIVKETYAADCSITEQIWANVAAYRGGFCVRFRGPDSQRWLYFYDNAGNFQGRTTQWDGVKGLNTDTGRGDGTRIGSDIRSWYVYLAGKEPESGTLGQVKVAVWDSRTREFVTKAVVSETTPEYNGQSYHQLDRVDVAVDALDRICVAYEVKPDRFQWAQFQVAARVMAFDGTKITPITSSFYPFINCDTNNGADFFRTERMSVAMTPRQICIAAKGYVNSTNSVAGGPDTQQETTLYTVINHPAPAAAPKPEMTISKSGSTATISWLADAGLFVLQSSGTVGSGYADVSPQPAITRVGAGDENDRYQMTVPIGSGNVFYRLLRRW